MDNERKNEMPSVAMSLVIDRSGSMTGLPLEMAKAAAKATVGILSPDDMVEVIAFDTVPVRFVKMQPARNRSHISAEIAGSRRVEAPRSFRARRRLSRHDGHPGPEEARHFADRRPGADGRHPGVGVRDDPRVDHGHDRRSRRRRGRAVLEDDRGCGRGRFHAVQDPNNLPTHLHQRDRDDRPRGRGRGVVSGPACWGRGLPQDIDVSTAPYLHGYVSTKIKPRPAEELLENEDRGDPILARWHVGLGWTLAWTSDVKAQWATEWLSWPGWEKFWGQLVHEHMRQKHRRELDMKTEIIGGELHAAVDAFGADDRFENNLTSRLFVMGPEPVKETPCKDSTDARRWRVRRVRAARRTLPDEGQELRQTAPGRYEATLPLDKYGSFLLRAEHLHEGQGRTASTGSCELRPCLEPLSTGVRELRTRPHHAREGCGDHGGCDGPGLGGFGVRPRR